MLSSFSMHFSLPRWAMEASRPPKAAERLPPLPGRPKVWQPPLPSPRRTSSVPAPRQRPAERPRPWSDRARRLEPVGRPPQLAETPPWQPRWIAGALGATSWLP